MDGSVEFDTEPDEAELLAGLHHRVGHRRVRRAARAEAVADDAARGAVRSGHRRLSALAHCGSVRESCLRDAPANTVEKHDHHTATDRCGTDSDAHVSETGFRAGARTVAVPPCSGIAIRPAGHRGCGAAVLVAAGGKCYLRGWARRGRDEWQAHYGRLWTTVLRWKGTFDPNGVLSNGFIRYGLGS